MAENMIQNEKNTVTITVTDADGTAVDVSSATITAYGKRQLDDSTSYLFELADGDFTKSVGGATNVVSAVITASWAGLAQVIVKFVISASNTKKGIFQIRSVESPE